MSSFPEWTVRSEAFNDFWEQYGIEKFEDECSEGTACQIFAAGMMAATHFENKIKEMMRHQIRDILNQSESILYGSNE